MIYCFFYYELAVDRFGLTATFKKLKFSMSEFICSLLQLRNLIRETLWAKPILIQ